MVALPLRCTQGLHYRAELCFPDVESRSSAVALCCIRSLVILPPEEEMMAAVKPYWRTLYKTFNIQKLLNSLYGCVLVESVCIYLYILV